MAPVKTATAADNRGRRLARGVRFAARVIGITANLLFMTLFIGDAVLSIVDEGFSAVAVEVAFIVLPLLLELAAFVAGWRRERSGGFLMLASYFVISIAPSVHAMFSGGGFQFYPSMWLFALPFLVTGGLFLAASYLAERPAAA